MKRRAALAVAVLACGAAAMLVGALGACSTSECHETLTCDLGPGDSASEQSGDDTTRDVAADRQLDAKQDAALDVAADTSPDVLDGAADAAGDSPLGGGCEEAGLTCTPVVPAGFTGPVAFALSTNDAGNAPPPPACAGAYSADVLDGHANPNFAPASCTCTCGAVAGGCTDPVVETFTDNTCVNKCNQVLAGACTQDSCGQSSQSAKITVDSQPSGGSCPESVQKSAPSWSASQDWAVAGRACAAGSPPDAGCPATQICMPPPPQQFGTALCVWQVGDVPCPSSYPAKQLLYGSGTDDRDCIDACTCGSPGGVTCAATVTASANANCSGATLLTGGGACNFYGTIGTPYVSSVVTPSGGSCQPGGNATPTGTVTPTSPSTVCCAM